jgi:hypothetical protein
MSELRDGMSELTKGSSGHRDFVRNSLGRDDWAHPDISPGLALGPRGRG